MDLAESTSEDFAEMFEMLFKQNYTRLKQHALRYVESVAEADDVVEEVFYELWKNREDVDFGPAVVGYLYRATTSRALNMLRHRDVSDSRIEALEEISALRLEHIGHEQELTMAERNEIFKGVNEAMDKLPERCREVFKLRYFHGLRNGEIADVLGVSVRTVEAHLYNALTHLRKKLKYLLFITIIFSLFR